MSEDLDNDLPVQDELTTLKARADMLGVKYHPSISAEKLRDKITAAMSDKPEPEEKPEVAAEPKVESAHAKRLRLKQEAMALVRIRVTCMNPAKKEWEGELFTAGNAAVGSVTKYVPFNADEGWHVPRIIYNQIVNRMCQTFVNAKTAHGVTMRKGKLIREFAVEVLPPLTKEELHELAQRQAMAKSID